MILQSEESKKNLVDYHLAAKAHAAISDSVPLSEVKCRDGVVYVNIETALSLEEELTKEVQKPLRILKR